MLRFLMGGLLILLGVSSTILGAAFVRGPLFYWSDLSKAGALQMQALVVGVVALVLGAVLIISALLRRRAIR